jgi:hypothetical protein
MADAGMSDAPATSPWRRLLLGGALALLLLAVAGAARYTVFAPGATWAPGAAATAPGVAETGVVVAAAAGGSEAARETPAPTWPTEQPATPGGPSAVTAPQAAPPAAPPGPVEEPGMLAAWPAQVTGRVLDAHREPIAGASIVAAGREITAAADGSFSLPAPPPGTRILVKHPGFEKATIAPAPAPIEVVLKRHAVKAVYLTYYGFTDRGIRNRALDLVDRTELNALVIDVKGDRGWILYRSEVPQAIAIGAHGPATVRNFDAMMTDLKARGIYTIARIVTFKDNVLAHARPDLAIIDARTDKPWTDREQLAWVDPFREEVWDYNIALAKEAARRGFDEIQFDYVRFPTDGKLSAARYSRPMTRESRLPTIAGFLARARREIGPLGAFVAADIFGYTAFNTNDTDIGQRLEEFAPHVDYLSPMVYPSGYHLGIPGYRNPVENPYHVVFESVRLIRKRSQDHPVQVRPWLQDFRDYAFDRRIFGVNEVRAQINASDDGGGIGWMLWNARNDYTAAALHPKSPLVAR